MSVASAPSPVPNRSGPFNGSAPVSTPAEVSAGHPEADLLDHEYDGIREYDNPTPGWWHGIFAASILFSILYVAVFHLSPLTPTIHDRLHAYEVEESRRLFGSLGELRADEPTILRMMADAKMGDVARGIFQANCAACHARDGGGINGVNLCDDHYKNVRKLTDIYSVISAGAANNAMPSWRNRLSENERIILAAYVANLRGTNPARARPPEGEAIAPWPSPEAGAADTSAAAGQ